MEAEVTGLPRDAPEGKWVFGRRHRNPVYLQNLWNENKKSELRKKIRVDK